MLIKNAKIFDRDFNLIRADIAFDNGVITDIGDNLTAKGDEFDFSSCTVLPGFIDIHIHGCNMHDATDGNATSAAVMSEYLASKGVTSFCPTTMTVPLQRIQESLSYIGAAMGNEPGAYIHGVNMEGPFICESKKGAQAAQNILSPNISLFKELCSLCEVKLVDIAPEVPGALEFIKEAKNICTVSAAHTAATYEQGIAGIKAGITHATHLYNAMNPVTSREAGMVGAVLESDCNAEIICDTIHICPATLRLTFASLGENRSIVISDSIMAGGLADGEYALGGQKVFVKDGVARLADGTLAGSTTNLFDEFKNLLMIGIPLRQSVKSCSINPAKAIGVDDKAGSIDTGKNADFLILDDSLQNIKAVFIKGKKVIG